jgi:hypothetical protein
LRDIDRRSSGDACCSRTPKKAAHAGSPLTIPGLIKYIRGTYLKGRPQEGRSPYAVLGGVSPREKRQGRHARKALLSSCSLLIYLRPTSICTVQLFIGRPAPLWSWLPSAFPPCRGAGKGSRPGAANAHAPTRRSVQPSRTGIEMPPSVSWPARALKALQGTRPFARQANPFICGRHRRQD